MAWALLVLGGLFEIGFTTCLRFVDDFRNLPWTLGFLVSVALSMGLLQLASRSIPMGTAYAVWGGIGALGTVLVDHLVREPLGPARLLLIFGLVACIAGLRLVGEEFGSRVMNVADLFYFRHCCSRLQR